jgi:hypothetical protein
MITPIRAVSIPFTSDGTSTALIVDLNSVLLPGPNCISQTAGVLTPAIAASSGPTIASPTATIAGSILTVTLGAALPTEDVNSVLIVYTLTFLLQLTSLPLPS